MSEPHIHTGLFRGPHGEVVVPYAQVTYAQGAGRSGLGRVTEVFFPGRAGGHSVRPTKGVRSEAGGVLR